jgi:hypothetical protein
VIVGNPGVFAIESKIARAYERLSFRALGYFVIHLGGQVYGVQSPDATMLACSFDSVEKRIADRGRHTAPFASESNAGRIADAIRSALYGDHEASELLLDVPLAQLSELTYSNNIVWAPDGDEAFDDGSCVLQFDVNNDVRLVAFKSIGESIFHDPKSLIDVWLPAEDFYGLLGRWRDLFYAEWELMQKAPQ